MNLVALLDRVFKKYKCEIMVAFSNFLVIVNINPIQIFKNDLISPVFIFLYKIGLKCTNLLEKPMTSVFATLEDAVDSKLITFEQWPKNWSRSVENYLQEKR